MGRSLLLNGATNSRIFTREEKNEKKNEIRVMAIFQWEKNQTILCAWNRVPRRNGFEKKWTSNLYRKQWITIVFDVSNVKPAEGSFFSGLHFTRFFCYFRLKTCLSTIYEINFQLICQFIYFLSIVWTVNSVNTHSKQTRPKMWKKKTENCKHINKSSYRNREWHKKTKTM